MIKNILPKIEFSADKTLIESGEPITLRWNVKEAEEVILWESVVLPSAPEPLDWMRISQLGRKVKSTNNMEFTPEETTAYYLVVKTPLGISGRRIVVEGVAEEKPIPKPKIWEPEEGLIEKLDEKSHLAWVEEPARLKSSVMVESARRLAEQLVPFGGGPGQPPSIKISVNPQVIFEDESTTLSWTIGNANCAGKSEKVEGTSMIAWAGNYSGTKITGGFWGAGATVSCPWGLLPMSDSEKIDGKKLGGARHESHSIYAENAMGKSATAWQWVDILSVPQFTGASNATRIANIRNAIKTIDKKLRNGCIYNDTYLDTKVDAFKKGHLDRKEFWALLLVQLQNIGLVTFNCKDVTDAQWKKTGGVQWAIFKNDITLFWSPSHTNPNFPRWIMLALVLKCGFNNDLGKFGYSGSDIFSQAWDVATACSP